MSHWVKYKTYEKGTDKMSQLDNVRTHLERDGTITPLEALELYGCFRLASVIFKLRQEGLDIVSNIIMKRDEEGVPKWYAEYHVRTLKKG